MTGERRIRLTVVVDSVLRMREQQLWPQPDVREFACAAERAGADGILMSLHAQHVSVRDRDPGMLSGLSRARLCLAATLTADSLRTVARSPASQCVIVPGSRHEHSRGGALAVALVRDALVNAGIALAETGIELAARIDPDPESVEACIGAGVSAVEFNSAGFALACRPESRLRRLEELRNGSKMALEGGMQVSVRGGLDFENVSALLDIPEIGEIRVGQALIAQALFDGVDASIVRMRQRLAE